VNFELKNTIGRDFVGVFNSRLRFAFYILSFVLLLYVLRLLELQIFKHSYFSNASRKQYFTEVILPAKRGLILDKEGRILATNVKMYQIAVDPYHLKKLKANLKDVAWNLSKIFGGDLKYYIDRLRDTNKRYVVLVKDASPVSVAKFDSFLNSLRSKTERDIYRGIIKVESFRRFYPYEEVAGHIIGAVGSEGEGLMGIEYEFDEILKGRNGLIRLARDGLGEVRASGELEKIEPMDGYSVKLTIDVGFQGIVEEELKKAVSEFDADGGVAIVVDPWTGDILALANYPSFNPNHFWSFDPQSYKNKAISDAFEPGSTFKIVPASILLEEDTMKLYAKVNVDGGNSIIRGVRVVDHKPYNVLSFREVLKYSSNIGIAKLSLEIDGVKLYRKARDFGFGAFTGIRLPGESKGELKPPDKWSPASKIYISFGYELRATPLQIAMAYASIANGGILVQPRLIKEVLDSKGKVVKEFPIIPVRRVISERTAKILTQILEDVVNGGTGIQAKIDGLRIAGKTGTAQIYESGFYSKSRYRASFVGFFPVEEPKFVCFVMLESPKKNYTGGIVAAPVFKRIAEQLIKLSPVNDENSSKTFTEISNENSKKVKEIDVGNKMPDLRNMSVRSAIEKVLPLNLNISIVGSGVVVEQIPKPGSTVFPGMRCILYCRDDLKLSSVER
jgi:cell division protein FtsI (penicillin-binding protein 3)